MAAAAPDPSTVSPGAGALAVFIFLLVAGFLLYRSLRKQLRKVDFVETPPAPPDQPPASS